MVRKKSSEVIRIVATIGFSKAGRAQLFGGAVIMLFSDKVRDELRLELLFEIKSRDLALDGLDQL